MRIVKKIFIKLFEMTLNSKHGTENNKKLKTKMKIRKAKTQKDENLVLQKE